MITTLTLGEKLKDERTSRKWTIKQVHNMLNDKYNYNLSEGKLSKLENDSLKYSSYDGIVYLAKLYNVTTDYLLGLSDEKTTNPTAKSAIEYTKLSESAVEKLHNSKKEWRSLAALSYLIENDINIFELMSAVLWDNYYIDNSDSPYTDDGTANSKMIKVKSRLTDDNITYKPNILIEAVCLKIIDSLKKGRKSEKDKRDNDV